MLRFSSLFYFWLSFKYIKYTGCLIKKSKDYFIADLVKNNLIKV